MLFAMGMAYRAKAEIILFHAFNQPPSVANAHRLEDSISELEKEKNKLLEDYAREVKLDLSQDFVLQFHTTREAGVKEKEAANLTKTGNHAIATDQAAERAAVKVICVCKFGLPKETILVAAEVYRADLVIMGLRNAGPVSQAFLGSTVAGVMQAGKVPVLALPLPAVLKERPTFVLALDLETLPAQAMLGRLQSLVKLFRADLKVLHLYRENEPQQEQQKAITALEALDKQMPDISYEVCFQQRKDIVKGIREFVQTQQADLLVLVPKHHSFLEILLQHTITGTLTEHAAIPLLTLPHAAPGDQVIIKDRKKRKAPLSRHPGK